MCTSGVTCLTANCSSILHFYVIKDINSWKSPVVDQKYLLLYNKKGIAWILFLAVYHIALSRQACAIWYTAHDNIHAITL